MPSYTFHCESCGDFILQFSTMQGNKSMADCPNCSANSKRVFLPPNLYSMSSTLKTRIEKGMEPRRMSRDELGNRKLPPQRKTVASRPWQA